MKKPFKSVDKKIPNSVALRATGSSKKGRIPNNLIKTLRKSFPEYLAACDIDIQSGNIRCLNPEHEDVHPSMGYYKDSDFLHCFSCEATYDLFDYIQAAYGVDFKRSVEIAVTALVDKPDNILALLPKSKERSKNGRTYPIDSDKEICEYLAKRGFENVDSIKKYLYGYEEADQKFLCVKCDDGFAVRRNINASTLEKRKYYNPKGIEVSTFNADNALNNSDNVVCIVEGAFDALSILACGGNALALNGVNTCKLIEKIKMLPILPHKRFIIIPDNDIAGRSAAESIKSRLKTLKLNVRLDASIYTKCSGVYKDINEIFSDNREILEKEIKKWRV